MYIYIQKADLLKPNHCESVDDSHLRYEFIINIKDEENFLILSYCITVIRTATFIVVYSYKFIKRTMNKSVKIVKMLIISKRRKF